MSAFAVPFETAVIGDVAFAVGPDRGTVRPTAGIGRDAAGPVGSDSGQGAGGDLDQQHRAVGQRHRAFGKLQPLGERAELHRHVSPYWACAGASNDQYQS
jgi:hypothetical protein